MELMIVFGQNEARIDKEGSKDSFKVSDVLTIVFVRNIISRNQFFQQEPLAITEVTTSLALKDFLDLS